MDDDFAAVSYEHIGVVVIWCKRKIAHQHISATRVGQGLGTSLVLTNVVIYRNEIVHKFERP